MGGRRGVVGVLGCPILETAPRPSQTELANTALLIARVRLPGLGLQARIESRLPSDPALAFYPGTVAQGRIS